MRINLPLSWCLLAALAACASQTHAPVQSNGKPPAHEAAVPMDALSTDYLYLAAQNALNEGNRAMAAQLLEQVVRKDPKAIAPRLDLASLLVQMGRLDEAEEHLHRLWQQQLDDEERAQVHLLVVRALAARGQWQNALRELDALQQEAPELEEGYLLRAQIHVRQQRWLEAMAAIDEGLRRHPTSSRLLMSKARLLMNSGNRDSAETVLRFLLKNDPANVPAVLMLGELLRQQKRADEAERIYRDFLAAHPRAVRVGLALGRLLTRQQRIAEAIEIYRGLAAQTGDDPLIMKTLGLLYIQQQNHAAAEAAFRKALAQSPDDEEAAFFLGSSLEMQEKLDEAVAWYRKVTSHSRHYVDAQLRWSVIDARQGRKRAAEARMRQLLQQHPDAWKVWNAWIGMLVEWKRYREAVDESRDVAARSDAPLELLYSRAIALEQLQRYDEMEASLRRILKKDPDNAEALNFLGYSMAERGVRLHEAVELIQHALRLHPDDPYYLDSLAWAYFKLGQVAKALAIQQRAVKLRGDDPVMFEHLGDISSAAGDPEAARKAYRQALEIGAENAAEIRRKMHGLR